LTAGAPRSPASRREVGDAPAAHAGRRVTGTLTLAPVDNRALANLTEREGKVGPMLIVDTETIFRNEAGETVAIQRGSAIRY